MRKKFRTFDEAVSAMPSAVVGNFDPLTHKSMGDLAWIAQHELDLYSEGEDSDIQSEAERMTVTNYRRDCLASA